MSHRKQPKLSYSNLGSFLGKMFLETLARKGGCSWPWEFHSEQKKILESVKRFIFAVAGIQSGKTSVGCRWIMQELQKGPPGMGFIVAPDYPMLDMGTMNKFFQFYPHLLQYFNKQKKLIKFPDGNELRFKSADEPDSLRGPTLKAVWIDEVSLCGKETFEIMQGRVITTGGRILCTGTPKGLFFLGEILLKSRREDSKYDYFTWPTAQNPGADQDYIGELAEEWSDDFRRQELEAELVDWQDAVFKERFIQAALDINAELREPEAGHKYVNGWDLARKKDWTVGVTIDADSGCVVAFDRFQHIPWPLVQKAIEDRSKKYPGKTIVDSTGIGDPVMQNLDIQNVEGFQFTQKSKSNLLMELVVALEQEKIKFPHIPGLLRELRQYRWDDKKLETDCVIALALAVHSLGNENENQYPETPFCYAFVPNW